MKTVDYKLAVLVFREGAESKVEVVSVKDISHINSIKLRDGKVISELVFKGDTLLSGMRWLKINECPLHLSRRINALRASNEKIESTYSLREFYTRKHIKLRTRNAIIENRIK